MNVDDIRKFCMSFPAAAENVQWGDDLCFKVGGKIFAIVGLGAVPPSLCFKCNPETFAELCEREGIKPAPYVGRYKWVLVERFDALRVEELKHLIREAYAMAAEKTKSKPRAKKRTAKPAKERKR